MLFRSVGEDAGGGGHGYGERRAGASPDGGADAHGDRDVAYRAQRDTPEISDDRYAAMQTLPLNWAPL